MVYCSTKVKKGTLLSLKTKLQKDVAAIGICLKLIKQNKADRTLHCSVINAVMLSLHV